jgi:hypothetical protein
MSPSKATDDVLEFESTDWFYQLRIVGRRDVNGDGIEDLEVDDIAKHAPRELATRASRLAQKFDVILKAQARVPDAEIDAILRQAADMSASIAAWRRSIGQ